MSQLLDITKKNDKNREKKSRKIIFGLELSEANNEMTPKKLTKNQQQKIRKIIFVCLICFSQLISN